MNPSLLYFPTTVVEYLEFVESSPTRWVFLFIQRCVGFAFHFILRIFEYGFTAMLHN